MMRGKGSRKKGDYWKKDHPDTGETLKFIYLQTQADAKPLVEDFLKSPIGKKLIVKWGRGETGSKKIKFNFKRTLERYKDWANTNGDQGESIDPMVCACYRL